jgi:hypothetical protein
MSIETVRFRRSSGALWRATGSRVVLTSPDQEDFDELSETAGAIWSQLADPRPLREIVETLADIYAVEPAAIAGEVSTLLNVLRERGWVEEVRDGRD